MADLECPRLDNGSGSDLLFYIELDAPGNGLSWCNINLSLLRVDQIDNSCVSSFVCILPCQNGFNVLPLTCC